MAKKIIKAQMKQRQDTKANWAAANPVLLDGELGMVSDDRNLYKVGDGRTAWNDLPFRGFDGTLAQELGTSPNAAISQKAVTEKLTELSTAIEPFEGDVETLSFNYTEMQRGAISFGAIQTFGFRTEPIAVKKGDYIVAKGFNGTPAYDFASEWNNGNYVQILYRPTGYGEQDFTLVVDADKSIVFSTSSDDIIISIHRNDVLRAIGEIEPIKEELNQKPNKKDFNFFGFAVDETTNIYEYYRRINLPNYTLKKSACFALQMGAKLYDGYGDDERTLVLDVSETGAKPFLLDGIEYGAKYSWEQGDMLFVYYDGEAYQATGFFGQSKANAVWGDIQGSQYRNLILEADIADYGIANHKTYRFNVKQGEIVYINTFATPSIDLISKVNLDGSITILEYGSTSYSGYRIGEYGYVYVVQEDMTMQVVCNINTAPKLISVNSFITSFISDTLAELNKGTGEEEEDNVVVTMQDINFFGFAVDETTNIYEYYRRINLPNYTLKKGACFALQMGAKLYYGYGDDERTLVLDVSETGAKPFLLDGIEYGAKYSWEQGDMLFVYYDGEAYQATGLFGQSKANAVWGDVIGATFRDLFAESEPIDSGIQWYKACKVSVKKGEVIFICTESTPGVNIISQILPNGEIKVLEHGTTSYSGYRIGEYGYIYEVQEDMTIKIIYRSNNKPKIIAIESYLTYFIDKALYAIKEVDKKATIEELNTKASAADLAIEATKREQDINRLQQEIDNLDFSGDIEQVVKDYIAEHPESVTSIQDNSITEAKFTDDVRKKKASYYPNVAAMVADTTLEIGMTAITKGYYAENDGGAGQYTIVARQTENGGSYISLNNGLTASLNFDGKTYILSQWGVRGDGVSRTARSVFPFLTSSAIKSVNPYFDDSVTDATYMIQYLLNLSEYRDYEVVVDGREYKISHTIFLRSMVTLKGVEDGAPRSSWIDALSAVGTYCKSSLIMQKAGIPMFSSDKYFDEGEYSIIQLFAMKNLNARGTFGNNDIDGDAGNFLDGKNMVITKCLFKNMNIAGFATGFKMVDECIWTNFDGLHIFNMRDNGIDFVYGKSTSGSTGQKNANSITGCIIYSCGRDYDKATGQYINRYGATAGQANRLPIDKPTPSRGNCIVVSYSGNYISNCDISDASVGVYRSAYSDGTTIVGLYSEEISMAQIYNDYTEGNTNSAELGGYLRADQWTDSKGNVHQNKRVANPNDFVE